MAGKDMKKVLFSVMVFVLDGAINGSSQLPRRRVGKASRAASLAKFGRISPPPKKRLSDEAEQKDRCTFTFKSHEPERALQLLLTLQRRGHVQALVDGSFHRVTPNGKLVTIGSVERRLEVLELDFFGDKKLEPLGREVTTASIREELRSSAHKPLGFQPVGMLIKDRGVHRPDLLPAGFTPPKR